MLELQSIGKKFGSFAMADVSLRINDGEYFALLGPSGVGKTVLIEIIAGLVRPDHGRVFWDDTDITSTAPEARHFAVVYQDYALFPHLTVAKNITFGLRATGAGADLIKNRLGDLADMLGITDLLGRYPGKLSGGQQQRVALARALAVQPRLLLLDEPLAALDTNIRHKLRRELKRINKTLNIPVLHVTHDPQEAMILADSIAVMLDNTIVQVACPEELFRRPSDHKVARFLGLKNLLPVDNVNANLCRVCDRNIHVSSADDSISHIWIKPEEIILSKNAFASSARNQFKCRVTGWDHQDSLLAVRVASGPLNLTALITHDSFGDLDVKTGSELFATFKSSAVHCF